MKYRFDYEGDWIPYGTGQTYTSQAIAIKGGLRQLVPNLVSFFNSIPVIQNVTSNIPTGTISGTGTESCYVTGTILSPNNGDIYMVIGAFTTSSGTFSACFRVGPNLTVDVSMSTGAYMDTRTNDSITELRFKLSVVVSVSERQIYIEFFGKDSKFVGRSTSRAIKLTQIINSNLMTISLDDWFFYSTPNSFDTGRNITLSSATQTYITPDGRVVNQQGLILFGYYYAIAYSELRNLPADLPTAKETILIDGVLYDTVYSPANYRYYFPRILE